MERQRENEDGKEEKQYERGITEEPEQDTRGAHLEESPHNPKETSPEKDEGEDKRKSQFSPEIQASKRGTGHHLRKTSATREPEAPQSCEQSPERAERGPSG